MSELTPAQRALRRAAGQLGGLTGRKDPRPATMRRLANLGADAVWGTNRKGEPTVVALLAGPATERAKKRMAAEIRLAKAQKGVQREKRTKRGTP